MMPPPRVAAGLVLAAIVCVAGPLAAQPKPPKTATEFYLQYRKVFDAATKVDELMPYLSADRRKEIEETPAKERARMFEFVKMIGAVKGLKILGETRTSDGATLAVEAVDVDRNPATGTITIVRESGAFRIASESWRSKTVSRP
jgi:hypothetical protein